MLTINHCRYIINNVCGWHGVRPISIKKVAQACERYDGNYSAAEYVSCMREYGFRKMIKEALSGI